MKSETVCALVYPSSECRRNYPDKEALNNHIGEIIEKVNEDFKDSDCQFELYIQEVILKLVANSENNEGIFNDGGTLKVNCYP